MAFNPSLPANNAQVSSAELRNQFNGLKEQIDTLASQVSSLQAELGFIPPGAAQITDLQAADPGSLIMQYQANRAVTFTIWRKGPGDADFAVMASGVPDTAFEETGLELGVHTVKVAGVNNGGTGPESTTAEVTVF